MKICKRSKCGAAGERERGRPTVGRWLRSTCQPPPRRARTAAPAHASRNSKTSTARHEAARQCQCRCRSLPLLAGAGLDPPRDAAAALAPLPPAAPFSSRRPVVGGGGGGGVQIRASVRGLPSVFAHCCWPVSKSSSLAFSWTDSVLLRIQIQISPLCSLRSGRRGFESCVCVCVHPWFGYFSGTQDRSRRTCLGSTELPCPAPGPPLMRHSDLGWLSSAAIAELLQ